MKNVIAAMMNKQSVTEAMVSAYDNAWRVMSAIYLFAGLVMLALFRKPTDEQMAAANEVSFVD
jgi:hypothetical protein